MNSLRNDYQINHIQQNRQQLIHINRRKKNDDI